MINISDYLQKGAENSQTSKELCDLLNIDHRELTAAIERERRKGSPICASCGGYNKGYYLAGNKKEMQDYCNSLQHRIIEIHATQQACLNTIAGLPET